MFGKCLKEAFYAYQDCNCFDKNAVKTVIFTSYYNLKLLFPILVHFKMLFISVIKAESSASLLLSSVSHDPSEIILICWFAAQETSIIKNIETYAAYYFCGNHFYVSYFQELFGE